MAVAEGNMEERLLALVLELSAQVTANKQACESLKQQIDGLQGQAVHSVSGFALRRFNVDLSQESFTSELERLNAQLVTENTTLSHEAKQMGTLLRECEGTLEMVMGKFRTFAHAAQQYALDLSAYYELRLQGQAGCIDAASEMQDRSINEVLERMGALVRGALRVVDGEDADARGESVLVAEGGGTDAALDGATELEQLRTENELLRSLLGMSLQSDDSDKAPLPSLRTATDVPATKAVATSGLHPPQPIDQETLTDRPVSVDEVEQGLPAATSA
ncbi:hypothetical protein MSPP1_002847 [Malassezia sp. CBS 17886]|nr:hypothetical protein MSPP1_002847 [Malassezia sp. CBS 17886]